MNHSASGIGTAGHAIRAVATLVLRDVQLLLRRPSRIIAAVATPLLVAVFFISGLGPTTSPAADAPAYDTRAMLGAALLVGLFSCTFQSIGLIQDRATGFLRTLLVAPAPLWTVAAARILSGMLLAILQSAPLLAVALWRTGLPLAVPVVIAAMLLAFALMSAACLALAWRMESVQGFHGIMNLVLMPAWLFSGAIFPIDSAAAWMRAIAAVNPLAWTLDLSIAAGTAAPLPILPAVALPIACAAASAAALLVVRRSYRPA